MPQEENRTETNAAGRIGPDKQRRRGSKLSQKTKLPEARIHGERKRLNMNINSISDKLQHRIFWIAIISIMTLGFVMVVAQIKQCDTNRHTSFSACVSAGGDAYQYQCCVANMSLSRNCSIYEKEGE